VFGKSTLARELDAISVAFRPFETLEPVLTYLRTELGRKHSANLRLA
jgi:hypothetical protein